MRSVLSLLSWRGARPWLAALLLTLAGLPTIAQYRPAAPSLAGAPTTTSLADALNPDGTLRRGVSGSFDTHGYRLGTDPATGQPAFQLNRTTGAGDENWQNTTNAISINGDVYATAVTANGDLYIGGSFTTVGALSANYIAKWNGTAWSALGAGVNNVVFALAVSGTAVYVGGLFTQAGGAPASRIARWNGGAVWSALGAGVNQSVRALAVSGTDVYVGGAFTQAGGAPASRIAKWNGAAWSALGAGVGSAVRALAVSGTSVYVGGFFTQAGGAPASRIAKWNGAAWSTLGAGVNSDVFALAVSGTNLYVGGAFTQAGGAAASYVAKWNGAAWSALGAGVAGNVFALAVSGTNVYVGGQFTQAAGAPANRTAKWDGSAWSALGTGVNSVVNALAVSGTAVYAGGGFTLAGGAPASKVAQWNGSAWSALDAGVNGGVNALAVLGTDVYVGGLFTQAGGVAAKNIAKWNGSTWSALGVGVNSVVAALAVSGTDLYVGGIFSQAGGAPANNIAKWNGSAWSALGAGVNNDVRALAVSGTNVYAGGEFTQAGGAPASRVAKWNGAAWSALGAGVNTFVIALAVSGTNVYVGGSLSQAGGEPVNNVAQWNGAAWSALGAGINGELYTMGVSGTDLYVGGQFTQAGGAPANNVAKWNGAAWSALGAGVNNTVFELTISGTDVYVGGTFAQAGGAPADHIAKWNGGAWSTLGTGLNNVASALGTGAGKLYVGGNFTAVGDGSKPLSYFASYTVAPAPDLVVSTLQNVPPGTYNSVTVTGTGVATLNGPVTVNTSLIVQTGGKLNTNCQPITGAGTFTLEAGATLGICDAAGITASGPTGAVQVTGARSFSSDATYVYNGPAVQVTGNGLPATVRELEAANPATVTLSQAVAVTNVLRLSAGTLATGGNALTLLSTASGTAYAVHSGGLTSGNVTVQRYVGGPLAVSYHHLASPVAAAPVSDLATAGFVPTVNPIYNTLPRPATPVPNVLGYDETRGGALDANFLDGYFSPATLATTLIPGRGYSVAIGGDKTPDFVGALTTGNLTMSGLTRTGAFLGAGQKSGQHLLGNPYAQPIDWDLATVPAGMDAAAYVWYSAGGNNGAYRTRANGVGNLTDGLIGVGQAFWTRITGAGPVDFTFTNALRVENNAVALGRTTADTRPALSLTLAKAGAPADETDETFVTIEAGATAEADARFDAIRPARNIGLPTLATLIGGQEAAINALPESVLTGAGTVVELTAALPTAGRYTLGVGALRNFTGTSVELLDRLTGTRYDLTTQPAVAFTAAQAGEVTGRFALVFGQRILNTSHLAPLTSHLTLWPNPASGAASVRVAAGTAGAAVTVFDAAGRRVTTALADATGTATLAVRGLAGGVYVVQAADGRTTRLVVE